MAGKYDESLFEDTKFQEPTQMDDSLFEDVKNDTSLTSVPEALARGAVQGVSMGAAEELGAGAISGLDSVRRVLGIETDEEKVNRQLQEQGFKGDLPTIQDKTILSQYKDLRDTSRLADKKAQEEQGGAYLAGEVAGGLVPVLGTGGAGMLAAKGLGQAVKQGAKTGAIYGGASGLGMSESDLTGGDIGGVAKDVTIGAGLGLGIGGVLPVGIVGAKGAKELVSKGAKALYDRTGEAGKAIGESGRIAYSGKSILSEKALTENTKEIAQDAEELAKSIGIKSLNKAKTDISSSLSSEQKINITDDVDVFMKKLDDALSEVDSMSPEARTLGNLKAKFSKIKVDLLKEAGQDPNLPTKTEAYKKLLEKKETLDAIQNVGAPQMQALDNLFNKAAKLKGDWKPNGIDAERIQKDFQLPDQETAIEMLKDLAKLKIKKPTVDKVSGMVIDMPIELTQVIKKYSPNIIERDGRVMLETAPGKISPSDVLKFRPDQVTQPIDLTPQQLLNLRDELRDATFGQTGLLKKVGGDITQGLTKKLESGLEDIAPEKLSQFKQGMQTYTDIYGMEDLLGVNLRNLTTKEGSLTSQGVDATNKIASFIEKEMTGLEPAQQQIVFNGFKERFVRAVPELGEDFLNKVAEKSKLKALQETARKSGAGRLGGTVESLGTKGGAIVGSLLKPLKYLKVPGENKIQKLSNATAQDLSGISKQYRTQGNERVANFLDELSTVTSSQKKNALLYSASQNQNLRDELFGDDEE